ncbi:hypothetical protein V1264_001903 [Littorina saxatilis]|uniref:Secreted protein n=1 Tax=Littorina saxatilis TaxID=31220 RepID=A0AAN9GQA9_9CAEN
MKLHRPIAYHVVFLFMCLSACTRGNTLDAIPNAIITETGTITLPMNFPLLSLELRELILREFCQRLIDAAFSDIPAFCFLLDNIALASATASTSNDFTLDHVDDAALV